MTAAIVAVSFVSVFTDRLFSGNGLAVVHDADDLSDEVMQAYARETKLSETAFVQTARDARARYRNRIFSPAAELPFAGHPSLGAAAAEAWRDSLAQASFQQETAAGLQELAVSIRSEVLARASVLAAPWSGGAELDARTLLAAVGGAADHLHPRLPAQRASAGREVILVPLTSVEALARLRPDWQRLTGPETSYFFCFDERSSTVRARCFAAGQATEDPATGGAAAALMGYLHARLGVERIVVEQGESVGRPSRIEAEMQAGRPRVSGDVTRIGSGVIWLPRDLG